MWVCWRWRTCGCSWDELARHVRRCGSWSSRSCLAVNTIYQFAQWQTTRFAVTDQRVAYQSGFLRRRGVSIPLNRVNNVNFEQNLVARMLNNGTVTIESAGETGDSVFENIPDPEKVQERHLRPGRSRRGGRLEARCREHARRHAGDAADLRRRPVAHRAQNDSNSSPICATRGSSRRRSSKRSAKRSSATCSQARSALRRLVDDCHHVESGHAVPPDRRSRRPGRRRRRTRVAAPGSSWRASRRCT